MKVEVVKTSKLIAGQLTLVQLLDQFLPKISDDSVVAISSKVVALCENSVVPIGSFDKEKLLVLEADHYMPGKIGKYSWNFTIKNNTLIAMSGIDESNGNGNYVLWPKNPQASANEIRAYLVKRFGLKRVGSLIIDSTSIPFRYGTMGTAIGHSGFEPIDDYIGQPDLFGRPFAYSRASIATGLAAAANVVMGEGHVPTPIAILSELDFVKFQRRNPTKAEIESVAVPLAEDIYEPFIGSVKWRRGEGGKKRASY